MRMSRMATACFSDSPNRSISPSLAWASVRLERIRWITASMLSRAMSSPSRICARARALSRSYRVRRVITSIW